MSLNGTFVNSVPVGKHKLALLRSGDEIALLNPTADASKLYHYLYQDLRPPPPRPAPAPPTQTAAPPPPSGAVMAPRLASPRRQQHPRLGSPTLAPPIGPPPGGSRLLPGTSFYGDGSQVQQ